jgi:hypothetical protein
MIDMKYRKVTIGDVAVLGLLISVFIGAVIAALKSGDIIGGVLLVLVACCGCGTFIFFWYVGMIKTCNQSENEHPKVRGQK